MNSLLALIAMAVASVIVIRWPEGVPCDECEVSFYDALKDYMFTGQIPGPPEYIPLCDLCQQKVARAIFVALLPWSR